MIIILRKQTRPSRFVATARRGRLGFHFLKHFANSQHAGLVILRFHDGAVPLRACHRFLLARRSGRVLESRGFEAVEIHRMSVRDHVNSGIRDRSKARFADHRMRSDENVAFRNVIDGFHFTVIRRRIFGNLPLLSLANRKRLWKLPIQAEKGDKLRGILAVANTSRQVRKLRTCKVDIL